ncbi:MAG: hypothetical protein WD576_03875 [Nitriliruptoraceae bacterium]
MISVLGTTLVVTVVATVGLLVVLGLVLRQRIQRIITDLTEIHAAVLPLVEELRETTEVMNAEFVRVSERAESIGRR